MRCEAVSRMWKSRNGLKHKKLNIRACYWGALSHGGVRRGGRQRSLGSSSEQGTSTLTPTPHQQPSAFVDVWDHAASARDAASVSRAHTQEYVSVKPDDHTVSACVSNYLPGVMIPVGFNTASSSKEHRKPNLAGYEVHEHIGGTFGDVYRAEWT